MKLDIDFQHGNGTQESTYQSDRVMHVSIHGDPNDSFPFFFGYAEERGEGAGEGHNLNLPLARGADWVAYQSALQSALDAIVDNDCRALVVSAGFDTCQGDPLGGFALQPEDLSRSGKRSRPWDCQRWWCRRAGTWWICWAGARRRW